MARTGLMAIILSNFNRFTKFFTGILLGKFAVKWLLTIHGLQCFDAAGWAAGRASGL